eukprot:CAMPEP_0181117178 /NCGR_PEP_ID=MMETSP1071-20121207/22364_1 /TAXON_ID=35127 /ORGANISM="Thalassiosira sp., Strain NH16" /LENGTH=107 /DNA_ID=CAMNT_0023201509 /DNA_START=71 /DNA_END=394 /DNA_ORIENTATION=-
MWSSPMDKIGTDDNGSIPAAATKVEPTACERECASHQKTLVACVDSIRSARGSDAGADASSGGGGDGSSSSADTPACLPVAVAAWTKCCEEANLREDAAKASSIATK